MKLQDLPAFVRERMREGTVIPAIPLALDKDRKFDPTHQRALVRYYIESGVGGLAVGVHTTQFEIREEKHGLFKPVLSEVSRLIDAHVAATGKEIIKIGGICGRTDQAAAEADFLVHAGYHAGLLSLSAFKHDSMAAILAHVREIADRIPIVGFYLQPAVGGLVLSYEFWREFAEIENILAIKIAPFNRYRTIDVVRAVCDAGKEGEIALFTGNDDNIVVDLLTEFSFSSGGMERKVRIVGGLLGHWCVWTRKAVELHAAIREAIRAGTGAAKASGTAALGAPGLAGKDWLTLAQEVTDANAAVFDAANGFVGCIPGIHEVLRRQGLLAGTWCLNPEETLSFGQAEEIDRVCAAYPHLVDDDFVKERIEGWLA
jgi:dihydrodipicolinate synthase/N-acetylneuraminate lyase